MRVLMVNTSAQTGGAAIAAWRLRNALNGSGVEAMLQVRNGKLPFLWERFRIFVANGFSRSHLWDVDIANAGGSITRSSAFRHADIIHLHWVNQGFLSMKGIGEILGSGKPVVWTLHDLWPCTGICHHPQDCRNYHTHCHDCPLLRYPAAKDFSWKVFEQKLRAYHTAPLTFVGVSRWTAAMAQRSALTKGHPVKVIPNVLPLQDFKRADKQQCRRALGIPPEAQVVVFGAARIDHPLKGLGRLLKALEMLHRADSRRPLHLLLFGACKEKSSLQGIPVPSTYVGAVSGAMALSRIYSAADVVVCASDYETFGQTLTEGLACGCPAVSFDRGGQTDIITHRSNGYLARFGDISDLAAGIDWALREPVDAALLRGDVVQRYSEKTVARQYIELYEKALQ